MEVLGILLSLIFGTPATGKLVITTHVAIVAHLGYCLSLNPSTMPLTWSDLSAM